MQTVKMQISLHIHRVDKRGLGTHLHHFWIPRIFLYFFQDTNVATTLAVIVWLRSKFSPSHDEWEMIEKKALAWLNTKIEKDGNLEQLLDDVKNKLWPRGLN